MDVKQYNIRYATDRKTFYTVPSPFHPYLESSHLDMILTMCTEDAHGPDDTLGPFIITFDGLPTT